MPVPPLNLFTLHSRQWQANRYVYPVISRRSKGLSVGMNLNPDKVCNFDCIYCSVDRTAMPGRVEVDLSRLRDELDHLLGLVESGAIWQQEPFDRTPPALRRLNDIAFSGDGEPTSFRSFPDACELVAGLVERRPALAGTKLVVITNATLFHQPPVQRALEFLDQHHGEIWAKLDAGTEAYYRLVERTTIPLGRVLDNLRDAGRRRAIVIQSLFMRISDTPPSEAEIGEYISRLIELRASGCQIKLVQIYTVARDTAESYVTPLSTEEVDAIVERARTESFVVEGYYGPG